MSIFTVTNTKNSGAGSLRQAVLDANTLTGKDIINFGGLFTDGLAHTISLTGSGLNITDNLTIESTNPNLLTISDNSADRVFDIGSGVTSAINGLTIINSYKNAEGGGAISNEGILTLSNSIITGNTAKANPTDIYPETIIYNGNYSNITDIDTKHLVGEGGGIRNTGSLTVNNSTITGNTAEYGGGGIYNTSSLTVNYSTITDNTAAGGGGIESTGSLTVNHSTITGNTADGSARFNNYGGGIEISYSNATTITTVNYSIISGNTAEDGGGIYYINASPSSTLTLSVSNSSISDNSASSNGGGFYIGDYNSIFGRNPVGTITVSDSTITGNSALKGNGGGIYDSASGDGSYDTTGAIVDTTGLFSTITVTNSIIRGNSAGTDGGGIYNYNSVINEYPNSTSSTITVTNSIISGNSAGADGGGINNFGIITVTQSTISDNTALKGGGGIYNGGFTYPGYRQPDSVAYGNLTVINSTISDNSASTGGGIYNNGTLSVTYSTINDNYALDYGGGIYNSSFNEFAISYPGFSDLSRYNTLGIVTVSYSSINDNTAGKAGGGIYNDADQDFGKMVESIKGTDYFATITYDGLGILKVSYSSITGNQAHFGAGIYNNASLTVGNSIIRHNKAFGIELSSGGEESGKGGGIYNSSSKSESATVNYSIIVCNFDTQEEDSNKAIKRDDVVGKFITKGHHNWIGKYSGIS
ncbi:beta strand repeat-containing protein [uncultured Nostoc sp.]|uniref:beta strand repeat-containing protein n=1 Tax=uncultured Nostoc sp. TaxID=340711 RepID=UPI0035CC47CE